MSYNIVPWGVDFIVSTKPGHLEIFQNSTLIRKNLFVDIPHSEEESCIPTYY